MRGVFLSVSICFFLLNFISLPAFTGEQGSEPLLLVKKKGGARYRYSRENNLLSEAKLGVVWGRLVREHYRYYFMSNEGRLRQVSDRTDDENPDTILKLNKTLLDYSNFLPSLNRGDERLINGRIYRFVRDDLSFAGTISTLQLLDENSVIPGSIRLVDFNNFGDREGVPYSNNSDAGGLLIINDSNIKEINTISSNRFNIFAPGYSYHYIYDESADNFRGLPQIKQIIRREAGNSQEESGESFLETSFIFKKNSTTVDEADLKRVGEMFGAESGEVRRVTITGFTSDLLKEAALQRAYAVKSYLTDEKGVERQLIKVEAKNSPLFEKLLFDSNHKLSLKRFTKLVGRLEQRYGRAGVTVVEYSRGSSSDKSLYKLYRQLSSAVDIERSGFFKQEPAAGEEERVEVYLTHRLDRVPLLFEEGKLTAEGEEELKKMQERLARYLRDYPESRLLVAGGEESGAGAALGPERRQQIVKALLQSGLISGESIAVLPTSARKYRTLFKGGMTKGAVSVWLLRGDKNRDRIEIKAEFILKDGPGDDDSEALFNLTYDDRGRVARIKREYPVREGYFNEWYFIYHSNTLYYINRWNYGKERFEVFCHKFNEQGYPTHYYRFRGDELSLLYELDFAETKRLQDELYEKCAHLEREIPRFLPPLYRYKRANPDKRYRDNLKRADLMVLDDELLSAYYLDIINWYREGRE